MMLSDRTEVRDTDALSAPQRAKSLVRDQIAILITAPRGKAVANVKPRIKALPLPHDSLRNGQTPTLGDAANNLIPRPGRDWKPDLKGEAGAVDGARTRDPRRDRPVL
jgi:hypothetical protein